jgi:tetratricopeptide (TPR) repeat protein
MGIFRLLYEIFTAYRRAKKNLEACQKARNLDPVMAAYRAGNYERGLALTNDPFLKAEMLIQLGRAPEGEVILRDLAKTETEPRRMALIDSVLGHVQLRRKNYDQAMECYQRALKNWPERGSSYRNIAEWWLCRGDNPAEALRWARMAVEKEKVGPVLSEDSKAICLGEELATLALAVAIHSRDEAEVHRIADEAVFPAIVPMSSLAMANVHFGKAWQALGDSRRSALHFDLASKQDPNGVWGREAASMTVAHPA